MYGNVRLGNSLGAEVVRTLIFKGILQGWTHNVVDFLGKIKVLFLRQSGLNPFHIEVFRVEHNIIAVWEGDSYEMQKPLKSHSWLQIFCFMYIVNWTLMKKMSAFSVELNTMAGQWTMSVAHTHLNQLREYSTSCPQHRLTHKSHWVIEDWWVVIVRVWWKKINEFSF